MGSLGTLTLASDLVYVQLLRGVGPAGSTAAMATQGAAALLLGVGYFAWVFGILSRRFERQADVFGCRSVSCDRVDCPPHPDLYSRPAAAPPSGPICPVGIRIFVNALATVADLNGMEPTARSWRHGSITRRIAFLEGLEGRPEVERRFQSGVSRLRLALVLALVAGLILAFRDRVDRAPRPLSPQSGTHDGPAGISARIVVREPGHVVFTGRGPMEMTGPATEDLEPFRKYLRVLAELHLDRRLRGKLDPSDVVQQTLARAYPALADLRHREPAVLAAWLRKILARTLTDALKPLSPGSPGHRPRTLPGGRDRPLSLRLRRLAGRRPDLPQRPGRAE